MLDKFLDDDTTLAPVATKMPKIYRAGSRRALLASQGLTHLTLDAFPPPASR